MSDKPKHTPGALRAGARIITLISERVIDGEKAGKFNLENGELASIIDSETNALEGWADPSAAKELLEAAKEALQIIRIPDAADALYYANGKTNPKERLRAVLGRIEGKD